MMNSSFSLSRLRGRQNYQDPKCVTKSPTLDHDDKSMPDSEPARLGRSLQNLSAAAIGRKSTTRKFQRKGTKSGQISGPVQLLSSTNTIADKSLDLKTMGLDIDLSVAEEASPPGPRPFTSAGHVHNTAEARTGSQFSASTESITKEGQRRPKLSINTGAQELGNMDKSQNQSKSPICQSLRVPTYGSSGSGSSKSPSLSETWPGSPVSSIASPTVQDRDLRGSVNKNKSPSSLRSPTLNNQREADGQDPRHARIEHPFLDELADLEVAQNCALGVVPESPREEEAWRYGNDSQMHETHEAPCRSTSDAETERQILQGLGLSNRLANDYIAEISDLCDDRFFDNSLHRGL